MKFQSEDDRIKFAKYITWTPRNIFKCEKQNLREKTKGTIKTGQYRYTVNIGQIIE